jgi:uncharacterized protein
MFSPLKATDNAISSLAETAFFAQWFHSSNTTLNYARWSDGEVDMVMLGPKQSVIWAVEVKWSDRYCDKPDELKSLVSFCRANGLDDILVTSRTKMLICKVDGIKIPFLPASVYCYTVGYNVMHGRMDLGLAIATLVDQSH